MNKGRKKKKAQIKLGCWWWEVQCSGRKLNVLLPGYKSKLLFPIYLELKKKETLMIKRFPNTLFYQFACKCCQIELG